MHPWFKLENRDYIIHQLIPKPRRAATHSLVCVAQLLWQSSCNAVVLYRVIDRLVENQPVEGTWKGDEVERGNSCVLSGSTVRDSDL